MSKGKPVKKKVVVTTTKPEVTPTTARRSAAADNSAGETALELGKQNYILIAAGLGLVFLGLILMAGGEMPSSDVWDDSVIYSFRRTVLAPVVMLAGLALEVYAIFKKF
ncbi:DUF3098 domain-containing protein [Phaeodactylibacter luteus]|uniref:DUF3098 domain-containing protein n=1 Tax=Phaeodactylibacter luteus TaxID=1564516 RepID=A0A5C6RMF1_9BACT|nr:DUF3098 domain-containing protein [Phaeodactylibacter luteus]TXB62810.1 DUF3098 domain-containing protein [Phaeodactylibacter luteus]